MSLVIAANTGAFETSSEIVAQAWSAGLSILEEKELN